MQLLRVIRGIAGTAVTWGLAWSALSFQTLWHFFHSPPHGMSALHALLALGGPAWLSCFAFGALAGVGFALLLTLTSRHLAHLRAITLPRAAVLGALTPFGVLLGVGGVHLFLGRTLLFGVIGSVTSVAAIAIARRATARDELREAPSVARLPSL